MAPVAFAAMCFEQGSPEANKYIREEYREDWTMLF